MNGNGLEGYKVIDLTHYVSGPYCTRLMAGVGMEVIKVEKPGEGDGARCMGPFVNDEPDIEKSIPALFLNANKKSITLNLKTSQGRDIFLELIKGADILVENFMPRVMPSLGLDYETLRGLNPALVMTSISNFGQSGPYRDYEASEIVEYALSGLMYITGTPEATPLKLGLDVSQQVAAQYAFMATLAALYSREMTGEGDYVDVSIMECNTGLLDWQLGLLLGLDFIYKRLGDLNQKGHPWGVFSCQDGWVCVCAIGGNFKYVTEMVGDPRLRDPKFMTSAGRLENRDEVSSLLLPWLVEHTREDIFHALCTKPSCAGGMVLNTEEIVNCPQLNSRNFFYQVEHPEAGKALYPKGPFQMSEIPWKEGRAPLLGEYNDEVYSKLGYSKAELVQLRQLNVI